MSELLSRPSNLASVPGTVRAYYVVQDKANVRTKEGECEVYSQPPAASLYLGEFECGLLPDGRPWLPTLSDMTPAGRMVRDILRDNLPEGCGEDAVLAHVEMKMIEQEKALATALVN